VKRHFDEEVTPIELADHSARHEDGGADEISLAGLTVVAEDIDFTLNEYTVSLTLSADNYLVLIDAIGGDINAKLPPAASHTNRVYTIKKVDTSSHKVTVKANGTETIDGEKTIELGLQYQYVTIVSDGDEWFIIGGRNVKMESLLGDIKTLLGEIQTQDEKSLFILAKIHKHTEDSSTKEVDDNEVQKELQELEVITKLIEE